MIICFLGGINLTILHGTELLDALRKALSKAKYSHRNILFSEVRKMQGLSPLSFYQSGRELFLGERFYWREPNGVTTIAGLGKIDKLTVNKGQDRYKGIYNKWKDLVEDKITFGRENIPATGPFLFGAFSFDQNKSNSALWDQFGDHFFYVPKYVLTSGNEGTYLTTNVLLSPEDEIDSVLQSFHQIDQLLKEMHYEKAEPNKLLKLEEIEPEAWKHQVAAAVEDIKHHLMDKVVLAREIRLTFQSSILSETVLERLIEEQETSYIFSLEVARDCFIGATPERLVKKTGNEILSTCLAGSIGRGKSMEEDEELGKLLLHDHKNLIEHQYVVSMIKKVMESYCHEVDVPKEPVLLKTKHVQHLYTPVKAKCEDDLTIFQFVSKLHPTPALGGLPKEVAVKWIRENELLERGLYAGPIGWTDSYGNGEFAVAIRSGLIQGNHASLFAGCGIVADSSPEEEYKETSIKFKPMLHALEGGSHGSS
jgi:menaquinone-specific isochorismate synthase